MFIGIWYTSVPILTTSPLTYISVEGKYIYEHYYEDGIMVL
jgi:hypothetical protein